MDLLLLIILILLLFGGGFGYYRGYWSGAPGPGYPGWYPVGGFLLVILIIILLIWLVGPIRPHYLL